VYYESRCVQQDTMQGNPLHTTGSGALQVKTQCPLKSHCYVQHGKTHDIENAVRKIAMTSYLFITTCGHPNQEIFEGFLPSQLRVLIE